MTPVRTQVKRGLDKDPRYDAVGSSSLREELFNTYVKTLSKTEATSPVRTAEDGKNKYDEDSEKKDDDAARKDRKQRAVREREAKVREERGRLEAEVARSRGALSREEGERQFRYASR